MQNIASGEGPNPAQAMLSQATGQNVANQAALMAGQRGASSNAGLMARQAANVGANAQQQAGGQAAVMQANQSLGALGQMGQMANQQVGQQQQALQGYNQFAQGQQQNLLNAIGGQNNAAVGLNAAQTDLKKGQAAGQADMFGNLMGAVGTAVGGIYGGPAGAAVGGTAGKKMAGGAGDAPLVPLQPTAAPPPKMVGAHGGMVPSSGPKSHYAQFMAKGGTVPALLSPGEKYLDPKQASQVQQGKANPMAIGKTVPGTPAVGGNKDDYANDNVRAALQEGGIVIPRSITKGKDSEEKAMAFVKAVMAHRMPTKR